MDNEAITAGVRLGGLNDRTEIKILICYLLNALKRPITQNQLIECICGQELVNYFEKQKLISEDENGFTITEEGTKVATQLEDVVSATVKRYAYSVAVKLLQYDALKKQNKTRITPLPDGGFNLKCSIEDDNFVIFEMDIHMPDEKTAKFAGEQFILMGQDIFKCMLGIVTDRPEMYRDILNKDK